MAPGANASESLSSLLMFRLDKLDCLTREALLKGKDQYG
jgi:hypothetical protein